MGRGNQQTGKTAPVAAPPVDNYRKQLGKSEKHREKVTRKRQNRIVHRRVEKQSSTGYLFLLLLVGSLAIIGVNVIIYIGLRYENENIQAFVVWLNDLFTDTIMPYLSGINTRQDVPMPSD